MDGSSLVFRAIFLWLLATIAGVLLSGRISFDSSFNFGQLQLDKSLLYLLMLGGVAMLPAIANYWRQSSFVESFLLTALAFCLLVGQTAGQSRSLFPFVKWDMYNKVFAPEDALVIEYVGIAEDGSRVVLKPGQIFPALGRGTLRYQNGLEQMVRGGLTPAGGQARHEFLWRLDASLNSMLRAYNRKTPGQPLVDIEIYLSGLETGSQIERGPREFVYSTSVNRETPAGRPLSL